MLVEIAESPENMVYAMIRSASWSSTCGLAFDQPAPGGAVSESRLVFLGDDAHGVPFEVVAVANEAGDLRVIHAMKLRAKYQREYEEAIPWRKLSSS